MTRDAAVCLGRMTFGYDTALGARISRDPIAEAGGLNLYGYVGNNPVNAFDPLGLKICVSPDDQDAYDEAKKHLEGTAFEKQIQELEQSQNLYYLNTTTSADTFVYPTNTIYWNPNLGLTTPDGLNIDPSILLGHEITHANLYDQNRSAYMKTSTTEVPQYQTLEERRVITLFENPTAAKFNEGIRTDHSGSYYETISPTSTKRK